MAAFNIVNDLTLEAVLAAAVELRAPVIVQTSVKTVKSIGRGRALRHVARDDRPASRCRSPCTSTTARSARSSRRAWRPAGTRCCSTPRRCRSRRTSGRPIEVVAEARRHGAHVEGEIEGIKGVEDDVGSDEASARQCARRWRSTFIRATGVDCFAPAIGNAHGMYASRAGARRPAGHRHRGGRADPDRAARRQRPDRRAVHGPDRAGLREGQHLHRAQAALHEAPTWRSCARPKPPTSGIRRRCSAHVARRRHGHGRATTSGSSGARARPGDRPDLRLRRRPGRHRALRPPAGVQPDVRGVRPAGAVDRGGVRREAARSAAARSGWRACSPTDFVARGRAARPMPTASGELVAEWHRRKTEIYTEMVAAGALPGAARASPGSSAEALDAGWTLAVASTSAEASVRAVLEHVVGADRAARFALVLAGDVVPAQEAGSRHLPARARAARASSRPTRS